MDDQIKKKYIDVFYLIILLIKGIGSIFEVFAGIVALFLTQSFVVMVATWLTRGELVEDPTDTLAHYILKSAHQFTSADKIFISVYLLIHGLVKIILVISLWKKKLWAYPAALVIFSLFIVYQVYRFFYSHAWWLIAVTLLDLFFIWLVWEEYTYVKTKIGAKS